MNKNDRMIGDIYDRGDTILQEVTGSVKVSSTVVVTVAYVPNLFEKAPFTAYKMCTTMDFSQKS